MKISFFEEFPTKENLAKLKLINFPTKLYLAATSLKEFNKLKIKGIYWPLLTKKEGYWFSAFSKRSAVKRIFNELKGKKQAIMLDLELPTTQNPFLYITQALNFFRNKALIRNFIKNYQGEIYAAEYFPQRPKLFSFLGIHYKNTKVIKMLYHSMHHFSEQFLIDYCKTNKRLGFGTIATGILKTEPILKPEQLKKDLKIAKDNGVEEVVIFRLGGMNKSFKQILTKA